MRKLWMQAAANIKKTKSTSITLGLIFMISALLINAGLLVTLNYGKFFDDIKKDLNASDAYIMVPDALYSDSVQKYLDNEDKHVKETQTNKALIMGGTIDYKDSDKSFTLLFNNMEDNRKMSKWKYVGEHLNPDEDELSVYVPDIFKAVGGYDLNDKITVNYTEKNSNTKKKLVLTVKGYTEDVFFSSTDTGMVSFYVPPATYDKISKLLEKENSGVNLIFTKLDKVSNISKVESSLRDLLKLDSSSLMAGDSSKMLVALDIDLIDMSRSMMASMIAVMMVVFAGIIVCVCLLVVRFRIINTLEDDVFKIGSLKSIGYTNRQIMCSILLQFLAISGIGTIMGIALSYPLLPYVSAILEQQSGLKWSQGFDAAISAITLFALVLVVTLVTIIAARRVRKLTPVSALRGETYAKKYNKNHLVFEKAKGNISILLAFKAIIQNMKQNIMIMVILIAVTFAGAYGVIMYYNTSFDTTAFAEVPGMEITNAIIGLNPAKDHKEAEEIIKNMKNVDHIQYLDESKVKVNGIDAACNIMDDYKHRNTNLDYEGHYPYKKGEIAIAGILAERINKGVGDTITIQFGDNSKKYKIVGLTNGSSMGGINMCMLKSDFVELNPDFKQQLLYIYLKDGTNAAKFIKDAQKELPKDIVTGYTNFDKELKQGMASYQNIVAIMGVTMFMITIFIITLVLYFVISSLIIRQKRDIGIQKAIGFTTIQLMNQISLSFIIPIAIGTIIGCVLGGVYTNPLMSVTMRGVGIMKANFIIDKFSVITFSAAILVFSYLLSLLITWRIRKISAYALVTE